MAALICVVLICAATAVRELKVWSADQKAQDRSPERLRSALELTPSDALKWRQLGVALLQQDPTGSADAFRRAVHLNRFETDALLGLALLSESKGDSASAESFYRRAVKSSRRFRPQYALAAFYARAGRTQDFAQTAAAAAAIDKADVARIVRLAHDSGVDPDEIPSVLDLRTEHALATYLRIAVAENRVRPMAQVAIRVAPTRENLPVLVRACDRLIEAGAADSAVAVWNRLRAFPELDAAAGRSLTNASFSTSPITGFNWRYPKIRGVHLRGSSAGLRIELSGKQPEYAVLLEQIAPVVAGRSYRLSVQSEGVDLRNTDGLSWLVQCAATNQLIGWAAVASPSPSTVDVPFATPSGCQLARVRLQYSRQPGTTRIEGALDVRSARLELLP